GTLGGAIDAFGAPTAMRPVDGSRDACVVRWAHVRLTIRFYNLGGANACARRYGYFRHAEITGRQWRTREGLRVGDPVARVRTLYPHATRRGAFFALLDVPRQFSATGSYVGLSARVASGRVSGFVVRYPAGGD
ncbi:MAG TPA: hypothetical protein VM204_08480, partial [Gaiellaceae bacterium]|nr:hypothetical protein [Gaiellaceae bacterium]